MASLSAPVLSAACPKSLDLCVGGVEATGRGADRAQVLLPRRPWRPGEHRRRDLRQGLELLGRQRLRAQDEVRRGRPNALQIGGAAGANAGHVVHDGAEIRRLAGRAVRQRGGDDARLQAQRAECVELVSREHHDALRVVAHQGGARRVTDLALRRAGVHRHRLGRARLVGPALIAEHAGACDLGGAGDDRLLGARGRRTSARSAATERGHRNRGHDGGRGGHKPYPRSADQHVADVNIWPVRSWSSPRPSMSQRVYDSL